MVPKILTPTPANDPDYVGEVIGYTDAYINHRTRAQMETLFRKVGGVYCYDVGYHLFDARAQFITILNDARENIAAGIFTANQQIGAILSACRNRLNAFGRYEGFSNGGGDHPLQEYWGAIGLGAYGQMVPGGGPQANQPGQEAPGGLGGGGIPPAPQGANVPPVPILVPPLIAPRVVTPDTVPSFNPRDMSSAQTARDNICNDIVLSCLHFNLGGNQQLPPGTELFQGQFEKKPFNEIRIGNLILVVSPVNGTVLANMSYEMFLTQAFKVYMVTGETGTSFRLELVSFLAIEDAVRDRDRYSNSPESVELQRSRLNGEVLMVKPDGFLHRGLMTKRQEAVKKLDLSVTGAGKHITTLDDMCIPVTSKSHITDANILLLTFIFRAMSPHIRKLVCPSGNWGALDFVARLKDLSEQLSEESRSLGAVHSNFTTSYIVVFRKLGRLGILNVDGAVAFLMNQTLPLSVKFSDTFDRKLTMETGRQVAITYLENVEYWVVIQLGEQWSGWCRHLVAMLNDPNPPENSFAHPRLPVEYFIKAVHDRMSKLFRMLATQSAESMQNLNGGVTPIFDSQDVSPLLLSGAFGFDVFHAELLESMKYIWKTLASGSQSVNPTANSDQVTRSSGRKRASSPPLRSQTSSRDSSTASSRTSSPGRVAVKPVIKKNTKKVNFEKITQSVQPKNQREPCHRHFLHKIGAKYDSGKPYPPCPSSCSFVHGKIPSDKKSRLVLAKEFFSAKRFEIQLKKAMEAIK